MGKKIKIKIKIWIRGKKKVFFLLQFWLFLLTFICCLNHRGEPLTRASCGLNVMAASLRPYVVHALAQLQSVSYLDLNDFVGEHSIGCVVECPLTKVWFGLTPGTALSLNLIPR